MLTLTDEAVSAVNSIIETAELPAEGGMRISPAPEPGASWDGDGPEAAERGVTLHLRLVEGPEEGDQVIGGDRVFLDPGAAQLLDDKLLDAEIVDNQVRFTLAEQPPA